MEYGQKRDYRKIDIFLKRPHGVTTYLATTTWAKNLKVARERYAQENGFAVSDLTASYQSN